MRLTLQRIHQNPDFTPGILEFDGRQASTLELPWRDNQRNISRIPAGEYSMRLLEGRNRIRLHRSGVALDFNDNRLTNTESETWERFNCDLHVANFTKELQGCIAVGWGFRWDTGGLIDSTDAMTALFEFVGRQSGPSFLEILDA